MKIQFRVGELIRTGEMFRLIEDFRSGKTDLGEYTISYTKMLLGGLERKIAREYEKQCASASSA